MYFGIPQKGDGGGRFEIVVWYMIMHQNLHYDFPCLTNWEGAQAVELSTAAPVCGTILLPILRKHPAAPWRCYGEIAVAHKIATSREYEPTQRSHWLALQSGMSTYCKPHVWTRQSIMSYMHVTSGSVKWGESMLT